MSNRNQSIESFEGHLDCKRRVERQRIHLLLLEDAKRCLDDVAAGRTEEADEGSRGSSNNARPLPRPASGVADPYTPGRASGAPQESPMYNRDQWIESFEGQLALLRPHLTQRVLTTMSLAAWQAFGSKGEEPVGIAKAWSAQMDQQAAPKKP